MVEQTYSWPAKKSFAWALELITGTKSVLGLKYTLMIQLLFLAMIFFMSINWIRKKFEVNFWFRIVVITYLVYYGIFITASMKFYHSDFGMDDPAPVMLIFMLLYFPLIFYLIQKYWEHFQLKIQKREELFVLSAFSLIFLLFASGQYNAWYILWFLPFVLAIENRYIRLALLWLMFWSYEGLGISLLPGLSLAG
jgi:hypothetical protein